MGGSGGEILATGFIGSFTTTTIAGVTFILVEIDTYLAELALGKYWQFFASVARPATEIRSITTKTRSHKCVGARRFWLTI